MPGMGGEEVEREINRLYPELPILLISGFYRSGDLCEGISGIIRKPFNREELFRAITAVLNSE